MDGLSGRDPNPELDKSCDYTDGYLAGCADREAGLQVQKYMGYHRDEELPVSKGQQVTIPKGTVIQTMGSQPTKVAKRTYKVTVDHFISGSVAYRDYHGAHQDRNADGVVRPTSPLVSWSGAGNYWHRVSVNDIPEFNS